MAGGNTSVVIAALVANAGIAVLKFVGYLLTGSPSMLSETYHSISDTGNQIFLLFGIRYSGREPDRNHPFGYGKAQFFYSFLVSVLLFGIAGYESLSQGIHKLLEGSAAEVGGPATVLGFTFDPHLPFNPFWVNVAVLLGAMAFEGYAFRKAIIELYSQIDEYRWSGLVEAFHKTSDVTTLTAFTEDSVAVAGALLALVGVVLSQVLKTEVFDAAAAVLIGVLLMFFAVALAWENKRLLLGESLSASVEDELRQIIREHEGVAHVDAFRTMFIGPEKVLVAADVSFDPDLVTSDLDEDINQIEEKLREADDRVKMVYIEPEL